MSRDFHLPGRSQVIAGESMAACSHPFDSTALVAVDVAPGQEAVANGRWRLAGDTLLLSGMMMPDDEAISP